MNTVSNDSMKKVVDLYLYIKKLFIECEEIEEDLNTNLQPFNEFRAALDHLIRTIAIDIGYDSQIKNDIEIEINKTISHLRRAFFDVCDLLNANFRKKIFNVLKGYDVETISKVYPSYCTEIRPNIEKISLEIANMRQKKGLNEDSELEMFEKYSNIIST